MLINPRLYRQLQVADKEARVAGVPFAPVDGWTVPPPAVIRRAQRMLLAHQSGSVKVGEVVRYTLTYTPSDDRILPSPPALFVKIKNTSAIALRAAYLHGPYTLYAACYPSSFDPNQNHEKKGQDGMPQFEPNLKAGGNWNARLVIPEATREATGKANLRKTVHGAVPSTTWIIEIVSQVIFSTSAVVHFELIVARDEKSLELGFARLSGPSYPSTGQLHDHQQGRRNKDGHGAAQPRGVYSKAVSLVVDDTASLWNKPALPEWEDRTRHKDRNKEYPRPGEDLMTTMGSGNEFDQESTKVHPKRRSEGRKKVHLVLLTHGLHSNLGSDMLYLKESIDAAAKQARLDARKRRARGQSHALAVPTRSTPNTAETIPDIGSSTAPLSGGQEDLESRDEDSDDEQVIVRGFSGNAVRTEKGIQYLGKRLAKYVMAMTYPDQPYLPAKKSVKRSITRRLTGHEPSDIHAGLPAHHNSTIYKDSVESDLAYQITSISFIGHSLGGLTQTYAIAYIYKHSPDFFKKIKPINFVALATPFLGLSNENPIYIKFALDFGLVGRTGQDLGLTWRPPTMVRNGWEAMIGGIGTDGKRAQRQPDPGSKPLLRILPSGPAHKVLKMFRNRTLYSNVVNDGIVPLRTSCLLFLDWRGLGRVEKARRENGLVGTMAEWGWAELTGANSSASRAARGWIDGETSSQNENSADEGSNTPTRLGDGDTVPQPSENATKDDNSRDPQSDPKPSQYLQVSGQRFRGDSLSGNRSQGNSPISPSSTFSSFFSFLRPNNPNKDSSPLSPKQPKIYTRSQTMHPEQDQESDLASPSTEAPSNPSRPGMVRGDSILDDPGNVFTPPKTSVFEAAGDILNPPLPTAEFLMDPSSRPRTIFHDRVYHPDDIPAPPVKRRGSIMRSLSGDGKERTKTAGTHEQPDNHSSTSSGMKVEEKIARAYHRDLSWRKVLVRLEPDAHNNIVVRRMFANAYGWPVIKHLVDTHFADTFAATTADVNEPGVERAKSMQEGVGEYGGEVRLGMQEQHARHESDDELHDLNSPSDGKLSSSSNRPGIVREDSAQWDDRFFEDTADEDDDEDYEAITGMLQSSRTPHPKGPPGTDSGADSMDRSGSSMLPKQSDEPSSEPDRFNNLEATARPAVIRVPVATSSAASTAQGIGLRKSLEEQLATTRSNGS